jgi:3-isopropylmalate dehydrogenase
MTRIAIIPGDGIGVDVTRETVKVLKGLADVRGWNLEMEEFPYGADHYLKTGETLPQEGFDRLQKFDAIFLGALGDPRVPDMKHAADILLGLRFRLDLFVNERPVRLIDQRLCPLRDRTPDDVNFTILRENTEGLYSGVGGFFKKGTPEEVAIQQDINTRRGVERICRHAFEFARSHGLSRVLMSDKSNALTYAHDLWQRTYWELAGEYKDIEATHMYVDALAMQLIKDPTPYEVIVTCNMFGDILSDLGAQLQGGLGLAASANLHPGRTSLFEPVHGSAPKYAGRNVANPMGALLSAAMMLEKVDREADAQLIERAVVGCVREMRCTRDLGGPLGTRETGDAVLDRIREIAADQG